MISKAILTISVVVLVTSTLFASSYRKSTDKILLQSFEHNVNRSSCFLCLGYDSSCDTIEFQLDSKRHAEIDNHYNYLLTFLKIIMGLFNTEIQNDKIFFGILKLNDTAIRVVAKGPGRYYSEIFEQMVNNIYSITNISVTNNLNTLLPSNEDSRNLVICSMHDTKLKSLHNFLNFAINNSSNSNLWVEAWVSAHLSVELLILKVLKGYSYVPDVYQTCGRVYFVEDCGRTLQYHLNKMHFNNRLLVARELLRLAIGLTDGSAHPNYSFYLTDLTADNIAIQIDKSSGLLKSLKVIDWSDVIVVANNHSITTNYNSVHVSEHVDCGLGCFTYSKENLCQADVSDHNIYAVCKEFLSAEGRLLHEITNVDIINKLQTKEEKLIKSLLEDCLLHSNNKQNYGKSRLDTAKLILSAIQQIIQYTIDISQLSNF